MNFNRPATYTDYYELTMAQGYFNSGLHERTAIFDYFFREIPFDGGYVIYTGLNELLETLNGLRFRDDELAFLKKEGFDSDFIDYLATFQFKGTIHSAREGEVIFPREPVLRIEGGLIEAQIIETLVLNILNFQSLIATKASRIRYAAGDRIALDFGLRRAQGLGGVHASRASIIGGLDGTSNVFAAFKYDLPADGTMAHSWVQSFNDELSAFRAFTNEFPDKSVLLVDTYDTLQSGVPNAITVAKELEEKGYRLKGIRLDSGDLAYFARQARNMLDEAGLEYVKIAASNQLDEYIISSLISQKAPIDVFGIGTRLVTGQDSPALDGVYKLSKIGDEPTLKISENVEKITLPGKKKIYRYLNPDGSFYGDAILMDDEEQVQLIHHPFYSTQKSSVADLEYEPLLIEVMKNGNLTYNLPTVREIAKYSKKRLERMNDEHKRFNNPHIYKVGISTRLLKMRDTMVHEIKEQI